MYKLSDCAFLYLLLPALVGIVLADTLHWLPSFADLIQFLLYGVLIGSLLYLDYFKSKLSLNRNLFFGVAIMVIICQAFYNITCEHLEFLKEDHFRNFLSDKEEVLFVEIDEVSPKNSGYARIKLKVKGIFKNDSLIRCKGSLLAFVDGTINRQVKPGHGDGFIIHGRIQSIAPPVIPESFNWSRYYALKKIYHQVFIKDSNDFFIIRRSQWSFSQHIGKLRRYCETTMDRYIPEETGRAIIMAMLVGDKTGMESDVRDAFSKSGVMHILAVSGLHVGIIYLILAFIFKPLRLVSGRSGLAALLIITGIWFYAIVTGLSPSVTRAAFMFTLISLGKGLKRDINIYNILACSAFFILCFEPLKLFDVGFQLSYIAVTGIVSIYPILKQLVAFDNIVIQKIYDLSCVTIAAQLATFPVAAYYFNQFPNYFLLANFVAIPAATLVIGLGVSILIFSWLPVAASFLGMVLSYILILLFQVMTWFSNLPGSTTEMFMNPMEMWMIYAAIIMMILSIYINRKELLISGLILIMSMPVVNWVNANNRPAHFEYVLLNEKNQLSLIVIEGAKSTIVPLTNAVPDTNAIMWDIKRLFLSKGVKEVSIRKSTSVSDSTVMFQHYSINKISFAVIHYPFRMKTDVKFDVLPSADVIIISGNLQLKNLNELNLEQVPLVLGHNLYNRKWEELSDYCRQRSINVKRLNYKDYMELP